MTENNDPAAARKRRKEIMQSLRAENKRDGEIGPLAANGSEESIPVKKRKSSKIKVEGDEGSPHELLDNNELDEDEEDEDPNDSSVENKKAQIRYDPDIPMSKEQLAAWRREARRVRNRESAAASRQRIRDRITELEIERDEWKTRFIQATDRLSQLERLARGGEGIGSINGDE
jgi:hypothetical protein